MAFNRDKFLEDRRENSQRKEESYEILVVRHVLSRLRKSSAAAEIKLYSKFAVDRNELMLAGFNQVGLFPLWLTSAKIAHLTPDSLLDVLKKPTRNPIIERFAAMRDEHPSAASSGTLGMVFAFPGYSQFTLLHNWEGIGECSHPRFVWYPWVSNRRQLHVLETLDNFLEAAKLIPAADEQDESLSG